MQFANLILFLFFFLITWTVAGFTLKIWEVGCQMRLSDFLLQQICFVQKEDGGGLLEPRVREDGLEQGEALIQSILREQEDNIKKPNHVISSENI